MTTRTIQSTSASVYVHDDTHGWVLVNSDFPTRDEAERFASLITDYEQFNATVSPINVMVSTSPPEPNTPNYKDVYSDLKHELKGGIRHALTNYIEAAQETTELEAL